MTKMGKFSNAIGLMEFTVNNVEYTLRPKAGDVNQLRKVMMLNQKDKVVLQEKLQEFTVDLISRDYPEEPKDEIKEQVEFNFEAMFEEIQIGLRMTTRADLDKQKAAIEKQVLGLSKKAIGED